MNNLNKVDKKYELINARYKLNLIEQKLVLSVISLIRPTDTDFMNYQIPISQFKFLTENENHKELRKACKSLMSKPLEIYENEEDWTIFNWFSMIKYKKGMLDCSIDPRLKPYLLQIKENFKSYNLKYALTMSSNYSIRIYEMLKQREKKGFWIIELAELQDILQVPQSYKNLYANFKKKVLLPAGLEIAKNTDIYYELKEVKTGRKVTNLEFRIYKNYHNLVEDENHKLSKFRKHIIKEYESFKIIYHPKVDRHLTIKNGLLAIFESGTILTKDKAIDMWKWLYNNQSTILAKPIFDLD